MAVEPIQKVIRDWKHGDITPEQAIGKNLLHTEGLYNGLGFANGRRQELSEQVEAFAKQLTTLQENYAHLQRQQTKMLTELTEVKQQLAQLIALPQPPKSEKKTGDTTK